MEIQVIVRSVFGEDKAYPANGAAADLASIAGTKTLAPSVLAAAQRLGHVVSYQDASRAALFANLVSTVANYRS